MEESEYLNLNVSAVVRTSHFQLCNCLKTLLKPFNSKTSAVWISFLISSFLCVNDVSLLRMTTY